ncbi:hypothetical protein FKP32DRAFT_1564615 [Trametes sanguinea]|nr:hypothetical protein FKP32DRAFT_1564615 [Trametes sanguinea]
MASDTVFTTLVTIPIYVQLPSIEDNIRNRHLLITVRLLEGAPDHVHLDIAWNVIHASTSASIGPSIVSAPTRRGVQLFATRSPTSTPIYVLISRLNRYGDRYHVAVAIHIHEGVSGRVNVHTNFIHIRRRHILRSREIAVGPTQLAQSPQPSPRSSPSP